MEVVQMSSSDILTSLQYKLSQIDSDIQKREFESSAPSKDRAMLVDLCIFLINGLLQLDPAKRFTAVEALTHSFLS
jgi:serine/threonine protein kinase